MSLLDEDPSVPATDKTIGADLRSSKISIVEDSTIDEGLAIIQLYDPASCLRCSHLLSLTEEQADELEEQLVEPMIVRANCHYSFGNVLCPAQTMKIVKYTDIDKAVQTYLDVLKTDDPIRLAQYMTHVGKKDKRTARLIMERIKDITDNPKPVETEMVADSDTVSDNISDPVISDAESEEQKTQPLELGFLIR